jgi:probable HAF family extracellular repeat protein
MTDIGDLGGDRSNANAINEQGQVVGWADTNESGINHAFVWEDGVMTDLGVLPDEEESAAYDINENGQICGASSHTLNQYPFPTYVTACVWDGDEIIEIGKLPGYTRNNAAGGINDQGQVVGYSSDNGNNPHAFIWEDGELTDLNSLLPSGSGWELKSAADINEEGKIVGYGKYNGETHGYLLIPPYINQKPVFSNEVPTNRSANIPLTITSLNITIEDFEGDSFNWSIETSPNIGSKSGTNDDNGTKTCSISGLSSETTYTWYVNSTDTGSGKWTKEVYTFTTQELNFPPLKPIIFEDNGSFFIYTMDPDDDDVKYFIDWDDGTTTETNWYSSGQIVEISHVWTEPGTYDIRVKATDIHGAESPWSDTCTIVIDNTQPDIPTIDGPTSGKAGTNYTYTANTTDPDGDKVFYLFDWGDGNDSGWIDTGEATYKWREEGTYDVKVKAKDIYDWESNWSDTLEVNIPRNRLLYHLFLIWIFERFVDAIPILKNLMRLLG